MLQSSVCLDAHDVIRNYSALLGEMSFHAIGSDPDVIAASQRHLELVTRVLTRYLRPAPWEGLRVLEIGPFVHHTGYLLAKQFGIQSTLMDISPHSLRTGADIANKLGHVSDPGNPRIVVGDFHHLPFASHSFDLVYICSALHHTLNFQQVIAEMNRVTVPGGLVLFEREPCLREACFYQFKSHRPEGMTRMEKEIYALDYHRILLEPSNAGSRSEVLFGVVENMEMPLAAIWETIALESEIVEETYFIASTCGREEKIWMERKAFDEPILAHYIKSRLAVGLQRIRAMQTQKDLQVGFVLPTEESIDGFTRRVAHAIKQLPQTQNLEHDRQMAALWGAEVTLVARKKERGYTHGEGVFDQSYEVRDNVVYALPQQIKDLIEANSLFPDIQTEDPARLLAFFPSADWAYERHELGFVMLSVRNKNLARIYLPGQATRLPAPLVVSLRFFAMNEGAIPYTISVKQHGRTCSSFEVVLTESFLSRFVIDDYEPQKILTLEVECSQVSAGSQSGAVEYYYNLSVATAFLVN